MGNNWNTNAKICEGLPLSFQVGNKFEDRFFLYTITNTAFLYKILLIRNYNQNMSIPGKLTVMANSQATSVAQGIVFNPKWVEAFGNFISCWKQQDVDIIIWLKNIAYNCQFHWDSFYSVEYPHSGAVSCLYGGW